MGRLSATTAADISLCARHIPARNFSDCPTNGRAVAHTRIAAPPAARARGAADAPQALARSRKAPQQGLGLARPLLIRWRDAGAGSPAQRWSAPPCPLSTIPSIPTAGSHRTGCACGRHRQPGRARARRRSGSCNARRSRARSKRYEGVVASAVMRAMFPQDAARRAFLKSVGASTALAAISQFFPLEDRDRSVRAGRRRSRRRTSRSASSRSPAPRRSSWRSRWASMRSTASTSK